MSQTQASWKILQTLGEGGMGQVSLARSPSGQLVAIKNLLSNNSSELLLFEQEAQLLTKLKHPAVARVLGYSLRSETLFGQEKGPCFWMEYVQGRSLLEAARDKDPKEVFRWFRQALEALQALHVQGILHSDLSPRNVLITSDGNLKLIDFGLAATLGAGPPLKAGTLPYMAPERVYGRNLPASDLFSLGTLFYEVLAGQHPRASCRSLQDLLRSEARPLAEVAPALQAGFALQARMIDRMIVVDLGKRFAQASHVLEALSGVQGPEEEAHRSEYHSVKMFGAEEAQKLWEQRLEKIFEFSAILYLHGITGVGKGRFLKEAEFQCAMKGIEVTRIPAAGMSAFLEKFSQATWDKPQAFFLEDLHQARLEEIKGLLALKRRGLPKKNLLLLFEWNDDLLSSDLERFFQGLFASEERTELPLKNLSEGQSMELLREALGEGPVAEVGETLFQQTGGNPRMLLELVAWLREEGVTTKKFFSREWREKLKQMRSFEDVLWLRLEGLPAPAWNLLLFSATAHYPQSPEALWRISQDLFPKDPASIEFKSLLDHLISVDLLRWDLSQRKVRLAVPSLEAILLKNARPEKITKSHRQWLSLLGQEEDAQRLHHALHLRATDLIQGLAAKVVQEMKDCGAQHRAIQTIDRSIQILKDPAEISRLLRIQANCLQDLHRYEEALAVVERVFAMRAPDEPLPLKTVKYWLISGVNFQNLGNYSEATWRFKCLLKEVSKYPDDSIRPFRVRAYSLLGKEKLREKKYSEAKVYFEQGLKISEAKGRYRAEILRFLAEALGGEGQWPEAKQLFQEAKSLYREEKFSYGEYASLLEEGNLAMHFDDPMTAELAYAQAEKIATQLQEEIQMAIVWNNQGLLNRKMGHFEKAWILLNKAQEVLRVLGNPEDWIEHLVQHAMAEAALGHFDRAQKETEDLRGLEKKIPKAAQLAEESAKYLRELKQGLLDPLEEKAPPPESWEKYWNKELALKLLAREGKRPELSKKILSDCFSELSVAQQVSFVDRHDYQKFVLNKFPETPTTNPQGGKSMDVLESLSSINRELLKEQDMDRVLKRLMEAAVQLSQAENGFLLLRSDAADGPIPGFSVVVARNIKQEDIQSANFSLSLSAIREAMEKGEPIVTDNALADPRFSQAKSVQLKELKSILALPLNGPKEVLGVFYLDHRFEMGLFAGETLTALKAFADQAALALQKAQMIEDLKRANSQLSHQVEEQTDQMVRMGQELSQSRLKLKHEYSDIVGRSPRMVQVLGLLDKITDTKIPVWIYGESGTGKESIARALHFNSSRAKNPFVTENCSALPETLLESELFGHKRGAFTHADRDKKGILQYAHKGTIFLDEIADMSLNLQAKLLRFLQEGEIRPLGSNEVIQVDVRVVSASNKDLPQMVEEGKFREDLFFRLNGITVQLPPLRERKEDIPILCEYFLKKFAAREKQKVSRLHPDALRTFMDYPWPGNIRELQNTLETAVLFAENDVVTTKSLQFKPTLFMKKKATKGSVALPSTPREAMEPELERILMTIRDQGFHKGNAARALGISRRNLYAKLAKHNVPVDLQALKKFIDEKFI